MGPGAAASLCVPPKAPLGLGCLICKMGIIQGDLALVLKVPHPKTFSPLLPRPGKPVQPVTLNNTPNLYIVLTGKVHVYG